MRREFICHRCGSANRRGVENCNYCGLQVGWRPSFPDTLRFWRWPVGFVEASGSLAASLAATVELANLGNWASNVLVMPLLVYSSLALLYHFSSSLPDTDNRQ